MFLKTLVGSGFQNVRQIKVGLSAGNFFSVSSFSQNTTQLIKYTLYTIVWESPIRRLIYFLFVWFFKIIIFSFVLLNMDATLSTLILCETFFCLVPI